MVSALGVLVFEFQLITNQSCNLLSVFLIA